MHGKGEFFLTWHVGEPGRQAEFDGVRVPVMFVLVSLVLAMSLVLVVTLVLVSRVVVSRVVPMIRVIVVNGVFIVVVVSGVFTISVMFVLVVRCGLSRSGRVCASRSFWGHGFRLLQRRIGGWLCLDRRCESHDENECPTSGLLLNRHLEHPTKKLKLRGTRSVGYLRVTGSCPLATSA
jgi:hypothetical protein